MVTVYQTENSSQPVTVNARPPIGFEDDLDESFVLVLSEFNVHSTFDILPSTPSEDKEQTDSSVAAIERYFVDMVTGVSAIERVLVRKDVDHLRIWMIVDEPDLNAEDQIYLAQLAFMDKFPEVPCDFSVVFRQGRNPDAIKLTNAKTLFSR